MPPRTRPALSAQGPICRNTASGPEPSTAGVPFRDILAASSVALLFPLPEGRYRRTTMGEKPEVASPSNGG